ncbi:MAG: 30S ribosomal protein S6--L-glutamate ligase [Euryarchaeota archaeon]|jgi:ribosomal protein S6--L-glutamate ligase|nr:30S ribosomal protein S6--L-glutamate ligase [Euryarchaeota archaeon]|tara:strand:+ start:2711 stop:3667 length:957 start_codon:yes stop_codon:yes gene_type:complete
MRPRLVILSRGPKLYSTKRLASEAEKAGWDVKILDPLALTVIVDERGGKIFYRGWPVECEAIIPRIGYSITEEGVRRVRQFERMGVIVMNSSDGITRSRDKLIACQMMSSGNIPVPITAQVVSWEDTNRAISRVGGTPCVVKATEGTHGAAVFLAKTDQHARQLVYQMLERDMRPLVQEYIEESHGKDIRALVVGGKVVACMRRRANGDEFRSNFHLGGNVEKVTIDPDYEKIAIKAARILGLEIAGVDLLESDRGALVLEVNSSPGLEGIEKASEVNVAAAVSERLNELLEKREENKKSQGKNFQSGEIGDNSQANS